MSPLSLDPRCVWTSRAQLLAVLARIRGWYATKSDTEISAAIATVQRQRGGR